MGFAKTKIVLSNCPVDAQLDVVKQMLDGLRIVNLWRDKRSSLVFAVLGDAASATAAISKLDGVSFMGQTLRASHARSKGAPRKKEAREGVKAAQGAQAGPGRVIVRNLPFSLSSVEELLPFFPRANMAASKMGRGFAFLQFADEEEATEVVEEKNASEVLGRTVAVDHAVPKQKYQQKRRKMQEEEEEEEDEDEDDDEDEEEEEEDEDEDDEDEDEEDEEDQEEERRMPQVDLDELRRKEADRKVFVRNCPFESEPEDLMDAFSVFGEVSKVLVVRDKNTGASRGVCFVIFADAESAKACVEADEEVRLGGRRLLTDYALNKDDLNTAQSQRKETKGGTARNLHLAWVGRIDQTSPEWNKLSESEQEKRLRSIAEKKEKLKNPNYHVSEVRVSVRNLGYDVDEKRLRKVFKGKLKQVKVVRDQKGKSKGFAFVHFDRHKDALQAVHRVNNNPSLFGGRRAICEFALDDVRTLLKIRHRQGAFKAPKADRPRLEDGVAPTGRAAKRQLRRAEQEAEGEEKLLKRAPMPMEKRRKGGARPSSANKRKGGELEAKWQAQHAGGAAGEKQKQPKKKKKRWYE